MTELRSYCRNLSSASQQTRQKMRECHGLVDSMIHYVNSSLEVGKSEDKVSPELVLGELRCCSAVPLCKDTFCCDAGRTSWPSSIQTLWAQVS